MTRFLTICVLVGVSLPSPARAQIVVPSEEHYVRAYDQMAMRRAMAQLSELEEQSAIVARALALAETERLAADAHRDKIVRMWSRHIQMQHGMRPRSHLPGTGWHEVHDHD